MALPTTGLLVVVAALSAGPATAARAAGQSAAVAREYVAVAHLDPLMEIGVNVVTGRFRMSGDDVDVPESGVAAIDDPLDGRLYQYAGGIPGLGPASADNSFASSLLPTWGPPRVAFPSAGIETMTLADGRLITVRSDARHRVRSISWPVTTGEMLGVSVTYAGPATTITDASGVRRTYVHDRGDVSERVPAAWRGPGYLPAHSATLDNDQALLEVQRRVDRASPSGRSLAMALRAAAGPALSEEWYVPGQIDGDFDVGVTDPAVARRVDAVLRQFGLLDVSSVSPVFSTLRAVEGGQNVFNRPLTSLFEDCHLSDGIQVDDVEVDVATTITQGEVQTIERGLAGMRQWAVIVENGTSQCATPV